MIIKWVIFENIKKSISFKSYNQINDYTLSNITIKILIKFQIII